MNPPRFSISDMAQLRLMLLGGQSIKDCARWFGCSEATIYRAQRQIIAKFGPIQRRGREQYTRWHLTHRSSQPTESA